MKRKHQRQVSDSTPNGGLAGDRHAPPDRSAAGGCGPQTAKADREGHRRGRLGSVLEGAEEDAANPGSGLTADATRPRLPAGGGVAAGLVGDGMAARHLPGTMVPALARSPADEMRLFQSRQGERSSHSGLLKQAMWQSAAELVPPMWRELAGLQAGGVALPFGAAAKPTPMPVRRAADTGLGVAVAAAAEAHDAGSVAPSGVAEEQGGAEASGMLGPQVGVRGNAVREPHLNPEEHAPSCGLVVGHEENSRQEGACAEPGAGGELIAEEEGCHRGRRLCSMLEGEGAASAGEEGHRRGRLCSMLEEEAAASMGKEGHRRGRLCSMLEEEGAASVDEEGHEQRGPRAEPEPAGATIEGLMARLEARRVAFENELAAGPQQQPCPVAGAAHGPAVLDVAASLQAGQAVYGCADCAARTAQTRLRRRLAAAGVPADVRHATLENFATRRPGVRRGSGLVGPNHFLEKARQLAAGTIRNLVLAGAPGIGKSHLGAALAAHTLQAGGSVRWADCQRLFADYHAAYETTTNTAVLAAHIRPALLVLDEVCLRPLPADGEEILYAILDARHKTGRRTLLLGNTPAKATRDWLGHRLTDRLRSGGIAFCYGEWHSMRGSEGDGAAW